MDEKGKFDEFGNKVEYTSANAYEEFESDHTQPGEGFNEFQEEARRKFNRIQFEGKAARGGEKVGKSARSLFEFAGDSIGLLILKNQGKKDLAYQIIKGGRDLGKTAEDLLGKVFREGGKVVGETAEKVDVDSLRQKAEEVKVSLTQKLEETELLEKVKPDEIKSKLEGAFHKVTEKVQDLKSDLTEDPVSAEQKKADLEAKIEAFEKLYEDESIERELHSTEGYKPEESKSREKY
ncbi:hypothetical protein [Proteiniclasticum sp. QWL-01]|uniref:hypothetical protein n=1 Tax=Proteiniclasticum sp. QWL-01 TaxID=3036945 RepID=UPI0021FD8619|nr:hypothetical protein [Proteiniclasticum sp. QWL-01]UUM10738.1 hypothetical protein NQU17_08570 [Clostridiaceae bacterium HFYG-1003]WFF72073.1 hypothetical protein P6M73_12280 [Proteiniclasticum sp. QWL-01]